METLVIFALINLVLALISIIIGIFVLFRVANELSYTVIFLVLSIIIIFIRDTLFFFGVDVSIVTSLMTSVAILLGLLAIVFIRKMIVKVDGYLDHKLQKRK